jgi:2-polyprenyl-3-methyl-5-hydroxy-6-metoxy-1,4-benzoquinol methylase
VTEDLAVRDEELTAAIREVQQRAKSRVPQGPQILEGIAPPDLMPLVHARDAAEPKVAAIGTVNPRRGGLVNGLVQRVKRLISRGLDWHIREQVEFNRASMACVQATLEALTDLSRSIAALAAHHQQMRQDLGGYHREAEELKDIRLHWSEWRQAFEEKRNAAEIYMLRSISEQQGAFQHRLTLLEQSFRQLVKQTHSEFSQELARNTLEVQKRLWEDLQKIRAEYEQIIHTELRLLRQKPSVSAPAPAPAAPVASISAPPIPIDWMRFAETFRGSEDRIRKQQRKYAERFQGVIGEVLDLGCGRGEFLEAARAAGIHARGIDLAEENVMLCLGKGLNASRADLFAHLETLRDHSLAGALCSQVIEHLAPDQLPRLLNLIGAKLRQGALVIFETPNPECLAIFATHFFIDPTHTRPVPARLLRFYLEEAGFGGVGIEYLSPAVESFPELAEIPARVRETFFGGLDYALTARKL